MLWHTIWRRETRSYCLKIIKGEYKQLSECSNLNIIFFRDLERAVEDLSELLESPIEAENIATLRQKMTDKTVRNKPIGCVQHLTDKPLLTGVRPQT